MYVQRLVLPHVQWLGLLLVTAVNAQRPSSSGWWPPNDHTAVLLSGAVIPSVTVLYQHQHVLLSAKRYVLLTVHVTNGCQPT